MAESQFTGEFNRLYLTDPVTGVVGQRDLTVLVSYDTRYISERYCNIDDKTEALSSIRAEKLLSVVKAPGFVLDYGCGAGHFTKKLSKLVDDPTWIRGFDIAYFPNDENRTFSPWGRKWDTVCFFDSLEHLQNPEWAIYALGAKNVMISVPWCHDAQNPEWFMPWKHRRYGEHLWHFGLRALIRFMARMEYDLVYHGSPEDDVRGRLPDGDSNILTAIFRRA